MKGTLALSLAVALALAACGGGEETTADSDAASPEADTEAIESLLVAYGLSEDAAEGCQLFSTEYLAGEGKGCLAEKWAAFQLTVDDVSLDGDSAFASVYFEDGEQMTASLVREGGPNDAYGGWKLADDLNPVPTKDDSAVPETETSAAPETETAPPATESAPLAPEQRPAAYRACIEGRGAKDIKVRQSELPSVDFSGGGSRVNATFGYTSEDAEHGLAIIKRRKPFFAESFGVIVLYTVGDPLAADLEIGLACAKEIG